MDAKMKKYLIILVVIIVLVIVLSFVSNLITGGAKFSYESIEEKLVKATKEYTDDLPGIVDGLTPNTSTTISANTLINKGYLSEFTSLTKDGGNCVGSVEIFKTMDGHVDYVPDLTCGNKFSEIKLYDKIIKDNGGGVVSGSGLYQRIDGKFATDYYDMTGGGSYSFEYVFRGDDVKNFVKIDDNLYRVVSIDETGNILLIYTGYLQKSVPWDDRFNENVMKNQGINDYENNGLKSRALENVESFYNGTSVLLNREKYSEKTRYLVTTMDLCVGKRNETDSDASGKIECSKKLEDQSAGILPAYYFMSASLDKNCDSITSRACGNYNYLAQFNDFWWLLTANSENTNEAFAVQKRYGESSLCSGKASIRPTIMLGSRVIYSSGTGEESDPYTVKFFDD